MSQQVLEWAVVIRPLLTGLGIPWMVSVLVDGGKLA